MNGFKTTSAILLALAAYTLLAHPARAQTVNATEWPSANCGGDLVCIDDTTPTIAAPDRSAAEPNGERTQTVAKANAETPDSSTAKR